MKLIWNLSRFTLKLQIKCQKGCSFKECECLEISTPILNLKIKSDLNLSFLICSFTFLCLFAYFCHCLLEENIILFAYKKNSPLLITYKAEYSLFIFRGMKCFVEHIFVQVKHWLTCRGQKPVEIFKILLIWFLHYFFLIEIIRLLSW